MATKDILTHANAGAVVPLSTHYVALWIGSTPGAQQLGYATLVDLFVKAGAQRSLRDLATGGGALSLANPIIEIFGTAAGGLTLTLPNGTMDKQLAVIDMRGSYGAHSITLHNAVGATLLSQIRQDYIYVFNWNAVGTTWNRAGTYSRNADLIGAQHLDSSLLSLINSVAVGSLPYINRTGTGAGIGLGISAGNDLGAYVEVDQNTTVPSSWPANFSCLIRNVSGSARTLIAGGTGTINGGSPGGNVSMAPGGQVLVVCTANPGTAPALIVTGDIVTTSTSFAPHDFNGQVLDNIGPAKFVGKIVGAGRDLGNGGTIGGDDNGKILRTNASGSGTIANTSVLAPSAGDSFICTLYHNTSGTYAIGGFTLAQNEALTLICVFGSAPRGYKAAGQVATTA